MPIHLDESELKAFSQKKFFRGKRGPFLPPDRNEFLSLGLLMRENNNNARMIEKRSRLKDEITNYFSSSFSPGETQRLVSWPLVVISAK